MSPVNDSLRFSLGRANPGIREPVENSGNRESQSLLASPPLARRYAENSPQGFTSSDVKHLPGKPRLSR
jgi:hypothetical protein